jgi:hypothetical protein
MAADGEGAALVGIHHTVRQIVLESKRKLSAMDVKVLQRLTTDEVYIACGMRSEGKGSAHIVGYLLDRNRTLAPPPTVEAMVSGVPPPPTTAAPAGRTVPSHSLFSAVPLSRQHTATTARSSSAAARYARSNSYHERAKSEHVAGRHEQENKLAAKRDTLDARLTYTAPQAAGVARRRSTTPTYKSMLAMQPVPVIERTGHMPPATQREYRARSRSPSVSIPGANANARRSRTPPATMYSRTSSHQPYSRQPSPATCHPPPRLSNGAGRCSVGSGRGSTVPPGKEISPEGVLVDSGPEKFERTPSPQTAVPVPRNPASSISRPRAQRWMNQFLDRLQNNRMTEPQWNHLPHEAQEELFLKWRVPHIQRRVVALWYSQGTF